MDTSSINASIQMDTIAFCHNAFATIVLNDQETVFESAVWSQTVKTMSILAWNSATRIIVEHGLACIAW